MINKEIKITEYELKNCNGNLTQLRSNWDSVPKVSSEILTISKGKSADCIKKCLNLTSQMSTSLNTLFESSMNFFTSVGIAFQESDEAASKNIDSITK